MTPDMKSIVSKLSKDYDAIDKKNKSTTMLGNTVSASQTEPTAGGIPQQENT